MSLDPLFGKLNIPWPKGGKRKCIFTNFIATSTLTLDKADKESLASTVPVSERYLDARDRPDYGWKLKAREVQIFKLFWKIEVICSIFGADKVNKEYVREIRYLQSVNLADMGYKTNEELDDVDTKTIEELMNNISEKLLKSSEKKY